MENLINYSLFHYEIQTITYFCFWEGFKKKSAEFSALFKTHPPHSQSAEKNKKKHGLKIILSKNKYFGKKLFFPIEKVKNT